MATRGRPRAFDRDTALQRAMDVFWVRGYEGASLAALTEAMEIRPPSLYAAFGSKEGLFREALAHYLGQHGRYRRDVLDGAPSAREGVAELLRETVARFCSDEFPRGCLVVLAA
ncbi:TetR/AcrR family transcriptional regulator, partial [Pseudomonas aeruginosa]|nr:TetR/AcrR family transcriptional regulator [Pseudomonas aeruginosa]